MLVPSVTLAYFNWNEYIRMNVRFSGLPLKAEAGEMWFSGSGNYWTRLVTHASLYLAVWS